MNQKHVPNLELCQELDRLCKEKGIVVPETEFVWAIVQEHTFTAIHLWKRRGKDMYHTHEGSIISKPTAKLIPAPLVSEQGEWLPNERRDKLAFFSGLAINGWFCEVKNYRVMPYERFHVILQEDTEANARQKMINYLIAEGIITKL